MRFHLNQRFARALLQLRNFNHSIHYSQFSSYVAIRLTVIYLELQEQ